MASSKAPYYYGELVKKDSGNGSGTASMRASGSNTPLVTNLVNNSVSQGMQQSIEASVGNNSMSIGNNSMSAVNNNVAHNQHVQHSLTDESPSSSSLTLSRPSSS